MKRLFALFLALTMVFVLTACGGGKDKPAGGSGAADPTPSTSGAEEPNNDSEDESPQDPAGPADLSWWSGADGFKEFLPYSGPGTAMEDYEDGPRPDHYKENTWHYYIVDVTKEDFMAYVDQLVENGATLWQSKGDAEEDAQMIEISKDSGNITFQTGTSDEDWLLTINFGKGLVGDGPAQIAFSVKHYWV